MDEQESAVAALSGAFTVVRTQTNGDRWCGTRLKLTETETIEVGHAFDINKEEESSDPFFFNPDYSAAAATGMTKEYTEYKT